MSAKMSKNARRKAKKKEKKLSKSRGGDDYSEEELEEKLPVDAVIRVYSSLTQVAYDAPWTVDNSEDAGGTGFVVDMSGQRRILTNAHVVANASFLMVRRLGEAKRYKARVEHISHEIDLAILSVKQKAFFSGLPVAKWQQQEPHLQDEVFVAGYPDGGDSISITKGIVSRIEAGPYTESLEMLTIQIDAAINPGNSGGPVFGKSHKVVGVAFSGLDDADGIGYIIPARIVNHYLESIRKFGKFDGVCRLGVQFQLMENEALCIYKQLRDDQTGVLINHVDPMSPCAGKVLIGDVLLQIDGVNIACDGTVKWRKHERVNLDFMIQSKFAGDKCNLVVLRDARVERLEVTLSQVNPLIPDTLAAPAKYVFFAGLIFVPLSLPFLETYEEEPEELTVLMESARRTKRDQELVVLSSVLSEEINIGYEDFEGDLLKKINGVEVLNLKHVHELLYEKELPKVIVMEVGENLVCFLKRDVLKFGKRIMKRHMVPSTTNLFEKDDDGDRSEDGDDESSSSTSNNDNNSSSV